MPPKLSGAATQRSKKQLRRAQRPLEEDIGWANKRQNVLCLTAKWVQVNCVFLDQPNRLESVINMDMRTSPIVVIKMRRKIVMMVMIQRQLVRRGHMEIVMRSHACTRNGYEEYLRAKKQEG